MVEKLIDRTFSMRYDGEMWEIEAKGVPVLVCSEGCDCTLFDSKSEEVIDKFLRAKLGILTPDQIHSYVAMNSAHELSIKTGISREHIGRYMNGEYVQSRKSDKILRIAMGIH